MPNRIAILGSTGSIGCNGLEVIEHLGGDYKAIALGGKSKGSRTFAPPLVRFDHMDHPEKNHLNAPHNLSYARHLRTDTRHSKLAVVALILSILGSPCILGPLSDWINWYLPMQYRQNGMNGFWHGRVILGAMFMAVGVSVVAVVRIRKSHGVLIGATVAWIALGLSLFWFIPSLIISLPRQQ